jgi:hypothetical protein
MKKLFITLAAIALMGMTTAKVQAGCGGCGAHGDKAAKAEAKAGCASSDCFAKMELSDDQKAKITEARKQCANATSKEECRKICAANFEKILTPEQYKQWQAATTDCPAAKGGCPFSKAAAKPEAKGDGHAGCSGH